MARNRLSFFSINCVFILLLIMGTIVPYIIITTNLGQSLLRILKEFEYTAVLILFIVFLSAPLTAILSIKSEDYRDVYSVDIVLLVLILILTMYWKVFDNPILIELPNILAFGLNFKIDLLTLLMITAAAILWLLAIIYSHKYILKKEENRTRFYFWLMVTFGGVLGAFMAADLLTMFLFFEIMYLSCYFLVAHNQSKDAIKAGNRYIYLGVVGGLSMLLGISLLYVHTNTFMFNDIGIKVFSLWDKNPTLVLMSITFLLFGFGIKAAVFPFHVWLPGAHSSAPSPASALLSGMVIKVYVFSTIKFLLKVIGEEILFSIGLSGLLNVLAGAGMIMGSIFALRQTDIKRILAYSSVAQVGYMVLGISLLTYEGYSAAMFHVFSHALMKSALFLSAGAIIYQKGKRDIRDFQGIGYEMPITMSIFTIGALAMIGIPGINGFMSKWFLSIAAIDAGKSFYVIIILISSFLNATYYLPIVITAFLKESEEKKNILSFDKIPATMLWPMVFIGISCILFGFYPQLLMDLIEKGFLVF